MDTFFSPFRKFSRAIFFAVVKTKAHTKSNNSRENEHTEVVSALSFLYFINGLSVAVAINIDCFVATKIENLNFSEWRQQW